MIARLLHLFDRAPEVKRDLISLAWVIAMTARHRTHRKAQA